MLIEQLEKDRTGALQVLLSKISLSTPIFCALSLIDGIEEFDISVFGSCGIAYVQVSSNVPNGAAGLETSQSGSILAERKGPCFPCRDAFAWAVHLVLPVNFFLPFRFNRILNLEQMTYFAHSWANLRRLNLQGSAYAESKFHLSFS